MPDVSGAIFDILETLKLITMAKQKATRDGAMLKLPKYVNAEMLMLEFFRDREEPVVIEVKQPTPMFTRMELYHVDGHLDAATWRELLRYINANI